MKLDINKSYVVYTNSNYIENKQIRVLGYINYDRASQYESMIENIAINEKFIESQGDTAEYLKTQIYYDCGVIECDNGEWKLTGEHIVLWDDIIDSERTQKLNEDHVYKLTFKFKNFETMDNITKDKVIALIESALDNAYNQYKEKVEYKFEEILDNSLDSVSSQLEQTQKLLDKSNLALASLASLEDSAKAINSEFSDNNIVSKVNNVSTSLERIDSQISTLIAKLS